MVKIIGLNGQARTGKDTFASILSKKLTERSLVVNTIGFADPIKHIAQTMFPTLTNEVLFGPSEFRDSVIEGAFVEGKPLTVRRLLIDIGENSKQYNPKIWINLARYKIFNELKPDIAIITDCRFTDELNFLIEENATLLKIVRKTNLQINHKSELEQLGFNNEIFTQIIDNSKDLDYLNNVADIFISKYTT